MQTTEKPLLNALMEQGRDYMPSVPRTDEDDKALIWNAKLFVSTKRTHCSADRFEQIFTTTMNYITTTEHHMYMDIQKGNTTMKEFVQWLKVYFARNFPEMSNENDYSIMFERLKVAVFQYYVLQPLIDHPDTSDIKVCAPDDIRVRVKGKAYRSSSTFLNELDLFQFVEGLALRNHLDFSNPMITFTDTHDKHYLLRFLVSAPVMNAVPYPYLHIRKVPRDKPDFKKLVEDEMLTDMIVEYLKDRIKVSRGIVFSGPPGCVDSGTEFFDGKTWKSVADYKAGDEVLQYDTNTGHASMVHPSRYIKEPCSRMYEMKGRGISQCLSPEHNMICAASDGTTYKISADLFVQSQKARLLADRLITAYTPDNEDLDESMDNLKLQLLAALSGTFYKRTGRVEIRAQTRKQEKLLKQTLKCAGIPYDTIGHTVEYMQTVSFRMAEYFPLSLLSKNQCNSLFAFGMRWMEGLSGYGKHAADLLQFLGTSGGMRTDLIHTDSGYYVEGDKSPLLSLEHLSIRTIAPEDGYKYCFTVPTHALVLRRDGCIFITGNSGKSTLLNAGLEVIPKTRETLVLQENDELHTKQSGFMFKHVTHGYHGEREVGLAELSRMALVEGCNEVIIGEVKGGEMRYTATLANSGGYIMYTTHSMSARGTLPRCADLIKQGSDYSYEDACKMLSCVQTIVYMEHYQVQEILENLGYDTTIQDFKYREIYKNPHPRDEIVAEKGEEEKAIEQTKTDTDDGTVDEDAVPDFALQAAVMI